MTFPSVMDSCHEVIFCKIWGIPFIGSHELRDECFLPGPTISSVVNKKAFHVGWAGVRAGRLCGGTEPGAGTALTFTRTELYG